MLNGMDPSVSASPDDLSTGVRVAKNSAALFVVALLTKGAGLILAVLIARYLGPAALGIYAVVMGIALLLEDMVPLGQPWVIIREVARDRTRLFAYWLNTSLVTFASSLLVSLALIAITQLASLEPDISRSINVVALYLPVAGLYLISQAAVQGLEQMEYLTLSAFIGRVLGLVVLWLLLRSGMGVAAAFVSYGVSAAVALFIVLFPIVRQVGQPRTLRALRPDLQLCWITLRTSFPFAIQTLLMRGWLRVGIILLPMLVVMESVGMFDAADRVRQTSAMIIPIVTLAILPTLSRDFVTDREKAAGLLEKALKLLLAIIYPFVFLVAITAGQIIPLLYGPGYEAAIPVLQVVIWSQLFFVADSVLNQIMMASDNERAMVWRTVVSLAVYVVLTATLTWRFGVIGAAWAVVIARTLNLVLDVQFVQRHVMRVNWIETAGRPLLCAILSAAVAYLLRDQSLWILLALSLSSYVVFLLVLRVFSASEMLLVRQLSAHFWQRIVALKR